MKKNSTMQRNIAKRLGIWAIVVAGILMIPLLANAPWTESDFVFAGVMLFGSAAAYELTTKNMENSSHRKVIGAIVLAILLFIWGLAATGD